MLEGGNRLGPYEVVAQIGSGGMGEVYRARDERIGRDVAIKVLPPEFASDLDRLRRFEQEARAAGQLNHPNIVAVHDVGSYQGAPYIVTELLEGETLRERLKAGGLTVRKAVDTAVQVAQGLAAAHEKGIIHRDLKPANVFITKDGHVKILDFGIAKLTRPEAGTDPYARTLDAAPSTDSGAVLGTMGYISPEQLRGQAADARSDIFSFGCVLYEMFSARSPFLRATGAETVSAILNEDPRPLSSSGREVPLALQEIVHRCLEKRPEDRFTSAHDLALALRALSGSADTPATVPVELPLRGSVLRRLRWPLVAAVLAVMAAALAFLTVGGLRGRLLGRGGGPERTVKLAVLPFANLTGDPEQEYLSDGLTQEMIAQLGRLHPGSLSVIARTSVMRYKKSDTPIDRIGRELGVDYVLEGSAQREAGRVRISAELIQVRDQMQLWAEVYERELAGILALQSDVAQKVAGALALKLLPSEQARLTSVRTVNPEAYEFCLKGAYHSDRLTASDLDAAQRYYELALGKAPDYALAHAGIAQVWACRQQIGITMPREAGPKAKAAALKAVELDDSLPSAHSALAGVLAWTDWDWVGAEREYRRAIELDPNQSRAGYSHVLMILRRPDEAMPQIERALELDPLYVITLSFHAIDLYCVRRYDEAIAQARKALRLQPDAPVAQTALILSLHEKARFDEVIATAAQFYALWPDVKDALERGYAELGYVGAWRKAAATEASSHGGEPGAAFDLAGNYLIAGDPARSLDLLEKACNDRDPNMPYISCWPLWDPLRSEPRFQSLLRRMNLPTK